MRKITILWLYPDLLDLYGDWGNLLLLRNRLEGMGISVEIIQNSLDDIPDFSAADLIYIGPGKDHYLQLAAGHLITYKKQIRDAVENHRVFLVTGNARLLFGKQFYTCDNRLIHGLNLFSYTGALQQQVSAGDIYAKTAHFLPQKSYGFLNRTAFLTDNSGPYLFEILEGDCLGEPVFEGTHYKNFYATWLLGPVLVKNPHLARELLLLLAGKDFIPYDDSLERLALDRTLSCTC